MEIIKKKILQALTTGVTYNVTGGTEHIIIPDVNATYYLKFSLDSQIRDIGFMDAFVSGTTAVDGGDEGTEPTPEIPIVLTGNYELVSGFLNTIKVNQILAQNYAPITEYGVLYTTSASYGNASTLTYDNYISNPTIVRSSFSTAAVPSIPFAYSRKLSGVVDTTIYFRAYAVNSVGVGYGLVKSQFIGEILT